jgi:hypothetical protein
VNGHGAQSIKEEEQNGKRIHVGRQRGSLSSKILQNSDETGKLLLNTISL